MSENYKKIQNRECEFFPCHRGIPEDEFNCLFCFCPLYTLKDKCGGNFIINKGKKDCSQCTRPHDKNGYDFIISKIDMAVKIGSDF
jgi:Zn-finger protein